MKLFHLAKDGGPESHVWGYWLIEAKRLFSVALLRFEHGSREAYHTHAFNSVSWVLRGELHETELNAGRTQPRVYRASWRPVLTRRRTFHRVESVGRTWVLTLRGPWAPTWYEWLPRRGLVQLTHGRAEIA